MVRRCWVNFQCRGVLLIWIIVGQGPIALAVGAGGGCLDIFSLIYHFSFLSPSLWETARYRLKYCLKGPLSPKQPTTSHSFHRYLFLRLLPPVLCGYYKLTMSQRNMMAASASPHGLIIFLPLPKNLTVKILKHSHSLPSAANNSPSLHISHTSWFFSPSFEE